MSINETDLKYHIQGLQRIMQHTPCGINILTISPRRAVLGHENIQGTVEPVVTGASSIAKKLDEFLTKYYDED